MQIWNQQEHASLFGGINRFSTRRLVGSCDEFNEFKLFRTLIERGGCGSLSDVGCASGGFYRFFRSVWPSLPYRGFDVSEAAIQQARSSHPDGDFRAFDGRLASLPEIKADIVFSRDVVHHQREPSKFLSSLYEVANNYLLMRLRTREVGATVFDISQSCQYMYGDWAPYIVFNTTELVDLIRSFTPAPARITLLRHPEVLGGSWGRFLPKELYYPETGTAETAVLIEKSSDIGTRDTVVTLKTQPEIHESEWWVRWLKKAVRR